MEGWRAAYMDLVNETGLEAAWVVGKINPPHFSLTAIVKGTFRLRPAETAILAEEQLPLTGDTFESDDPSKPLRYPADFAPFKPRADALLVGTCHVPGGNPVTAARVTFQIGPRTKSLVVYGDREWTTEGVSTDPAPFTALPLTWERAYGGPAFERNPLGIGFAASERGVVRDGDPLPNIESPDRLLRLKSAIGEAAGFGPIPDSWPQRMHKCGTFDDGYLKERWPWSPANMDWGFFNAAPEDQQIQGYLRGDEELYMENLHPATSQYRSQLPGVRVRCFLDELVRQHYELREIPMRLDTSWVDMDTETLVLVWRGYVDVRSRNLIGTEHFFVLTEPLERLPDDVKQCARLLEEALARREMEEEELDPEEEPEDLAAAEDAEEPAADSAPASSGGDTARASGEATGAEDSEGAEAVVPDEPSPDEAPLTAERVQRMAAQRASLAGCDLGGLALAGFDLSGLDLREAILEKVNLAGANLSQADLTGAVLRGANLRGARCAGTIFAEADLSETWFTEADLSGADLRGADLTKARLRLARMPGVNASEAVFAEADLSDATLVGANLSAADLCDTLVHRTDFSRADLSEAAFENAWGRHVKAVGATLLKVRGAEALFCEADFRHSIADESVWESAQLFGTKFSGSRFNNAEFSGAFLADALFDGAELKGARLNEATLRGAQMRRCNLLEASLDEADLTDATFRESNLFGATLMDAVRDRTRFTGANLRRIKSREDVR
jgi:uncharacterized protein YjbI with pentapeptide repeats